MSGNLLARLTALGVMTTQEFKQHGRELFGSEPPAYSHRFLESRLAYQIQKLVYDGLRPEIMQRSNVLSQQLEDGQIDVHRKRTDHDRSIADMRLIREWQGVEHTGIQDGLAVPVLQVAPRGGLGDRGHTLERLDVLWAADRGLRLLGRRAGALGTEAAPDGQ